VRTGEKIEAVILKIDDTNKRLSLGYEIINTNPWDTYAAVLLVDTIHSGTIISVINKGAIVAFTCGLQVFAPTGHLIKFDRSFPKAKEILDFKILKFDNRNRKVFISHAITHSSVFNKATI
jgi:small subunit ribosomal protein S1